MASPTSQRIRLCLSNRPYQWFRFQQQSSRFSSILRLNVLESCWLGGHCHLDPWGGAVSPPVLLLGIAPFFKTDLPWWGTPALETPGAVPTCQNTAGWLTPSWLPQLPDPRAPLNQGLSCLQLHSRGWSAFWLGINCTYQPEHFCSTCQLDMVESLSLHAHLTWKVGFETEKNCEPS